MKTVQSLKITSHIGRDLLASAGYFTTEQAVAWEYVVNSLQYVDPGVSPKVFVKVNASAKSLTIADNGRGMNSDDLEHFFKMHAENKDRMAGRAGRGKFGTGKSAAFGIATSLQIDTRRNGLRNVVTITRRQIEQSAGEEIPAEWSIRNEHTDEQNGTTVTISGIFLPSIRTAPIIEYVERHLQAFRARAPEVAVNNHVCTYREPEIAFERRFSPSAEQEKVFGPTQLVVKAARAPLPDAEQGVAVTAGIGNLVAVERGGIQAKEFGNYLLGEIDVPAIENADSKIDPYDSSRSLRLNPQNPLVAVLIGFIGSKLEAVRLELLRDSKEAKKDEEARRLALEAESIAEILNQDFRQVRSRLHEIRAASAKSGPAGAQFGDSDTGGGDLDGWVSGTEEPGNIEETASPKGPGEPHGRPAPSITQRGDRADNGRASVDPAGGRGKQKSKPRGGFRVKYDKLGREEERSRYDGPTLTILINLEHPVLEAALKHGNTQDPSFRRLSYEIAFAEYAMGLGYEIQKQDPNIPADDLLYEVRSALNRVASSAAILYR
jgi:hypothetical protein